MTKNEALKLALVALEESQTDNDTMEFWDRKIKAITAIKEALAQPEQEPVAWMVKLGEVSCFQHHADSKHASVPLYTTPPLRERQPLTDEEIQVIWDVATSAIPGWSRHIGYARAIEAAHNIGGAKP